MFRIISLPNKLGSFYKLSEPLSHFRSCSSQAKVLPLSANLQLNQKSSIQTFKKRYATANAEKVEIPPPPIDLKARRLKLIGIGIIGFGIYIAGLFVYESSELDRKWKEAKKAKPIKVEPLPYLKDSPPEVNYAKSIFNPKDTSGLKITLYQFQTCPFCCKVRAFLDYYGFSYNVVEVNSVTRKEVKWSDYKKVPFLTVEIPNEDKNMKPTYVQLKDSSVIVSLFSSCLRNPMESLENLLLSFPSYKDPQNDYRLQFDNKYFIMYTEKGDLAKQQKYIKKERRLRSWVDDKFIHTLSPNVYRTPKEALQAFTWFSEVGEWERLFPTWERLSVIYIGAAAMWLIGKRLKTKYNINSDPRITLYDQANLWMQEVESAGGKFIGGDHPNLADLSMYGVLSAIEGCDAFQDLKEKTKISVWYDKMKVAVMEHRGDNELANGNAIR